SCRRSTSPWPRSTSRAATWRRPGGRSRRSWRSCRRAGARSPSGARSSPRLRRDRPRRGARAGPGRRRNVEPPGAAAPGRAGAGPRRFTLAMAYVVLGRPDWARPELAALSAADPGNPLYPYWLARLDYDQEHYAEAVAGFRRALALDPAYARAHDNLGLSYEAL